eukprot:406634_1
MGVIKNKTYNAEHERITDEVIVSEDDDVIIQGLRQQIEAKSQAIRELEAEKLTHQDRIQELHTNLQDTQRVITNVIDSDIQEVRLGCYHCGKDGHLARNCPDEDDDKCFRCGKTGHWARDCEIDLESRNRINNNDACHRCGKFGHWAPECDLPYQFNNLENDKCNRCGKKGHWPRDCDLPRDLPYQFNNLSENDKCNRCGKKGHWARDCDSPSKPKGKKKLCRGFQTGTCTSNRVDFYTNARSVTEWVMGDYIKLLNRVRKHNPKVYVEFYINCADCIDSGDTMSKYPRPLLHF